MPIWPVRLLTWQLVVIYVTSVWWKLMGRSWRAGTAMAIALHHPNFARFPHVANALLPLTRVGTFAALAFESSWLLLLVPRSAIPERWRLIPLRRVLIVSGVLFHLSIFLLMDVGVFSIAMISSYCGLLTADDFAWARAFASTSSRLASSPEMGVALASLPRVAARARAKRGELPRIDAPSTSS
jgi:hypothetical protein